MAVFCRCRREFVAHYEWVLPSIKVYPLYSWSPAPAPACGLHRIGGLASGGGQERGGQIPREGGREEGASRKIDFEPEREEAGWKRREWIGEWVCPTEYIVKPRGQAVRLPTVDIQRDTQNRGIIHSGFFIRDVGFFFTGYIP